MFFSELIKQRPVVRRNVANRPQHHAIAPKSLRKPIPSYPLKTGSNGISGTAEKFIPAYEKLRTLKKTNVYLSGIASYFSAYKIDECLIDNIEAFLIRTFANDLTNVRMEKFKF